MTVGDIIANDDFEAFSDSIQILDEDTVTQHWLTYVSQAWLDANDIGQEGYTVGWYKTTDEDLATPMNDISLPLGSAVMVYVGSADAKLGYKGEVADEAKYVSVPVDGYGFIGNASPSALKLGELKPSSGFEPFTDSIQILDAETVTQHWLTYVSQAWLDANDIGQEGYTVGWYKTTDEDLATPMNDIVLNAGDAFMTYVSTDVNFEIPSAL